MRHVFPTDQVIHLWAHQAQENARNGSNVSFEGPELYSYSTTIAAIIDGVAYISDHNMSTTTGRHVRVATQAARHMEQFFTPAFTWSGSNPRLTHEAMILPAARQAVQTLEYALVDSRTRKATKEKVVQEYIQDRERIATHAARFNVQVFMPEMSAGQSAIAEYLKAKRITEEKKEVARLKAVKKQQREDMKQLKRITEEKKEAARLKAVKKQQREDKAQLKTWLETGAGRFPTSFYTRDADQITIKTTKQINRYNDIETSSQIIVTSQCAECPLDHAIKALKFYESRKCTNLRPADPQLFESYKTNGHKIPLGHFTLDEIREDGTVKVGCHTFTAKEIQRFINQWRSVLGL